MLGLGYGKGSDWSISGGNTYLMIPGDEVKCKMHPCAVLYSAKCTNTRKSASLCAPMHCIYDLTQR